MRFKNLEVEKVFRKISGSFNDWFLFFFSIERKWSAYIRETKWNLLPGRSKSCKKASPYFFSRFLPSLMSCRWEKRYKSQYFKKHTYKKRKSWNVSYRHTHPPLELLLEILIFRYIHVLLALQRRITYAYVLFLHYFYQNLLIIFGKIFLYNNLTYLV